MKNTQLDFEADPFGYFLQGHIESRNELTKEQKSRLMDQYSFAVEMLPFKDEIKFICENCDLFLKKLEEITFEEYRIFYRETTGKELTPERFEEFKRLARRFANPSRLKSSLKCMDLHQKYQPQRRSTIKIAASRSK